MLETSTVSRKRAPAFEIHPESRKLNRTSAKRAPEHEAILGKPVDRSRCLGRVQWVTKGENNRTGGKLERASLCRHPAEINPGIVGLPEKPKLSSSKGTAHIQRAAYLSSLAPWARRSWSRSVGPSPGSLDRKAARKGSQPSTNIRRKLAASVPWAVRFTVTISWTSIPG